MKEIPLGLETPLNKALRGQPKTLRPRQAAKVETKAALYRFGHLYNVAALKRK